MLTENSIDARFGSVRLPTTVKQTHIVLTYVCNVVAVQVHFRLTSFGVKLYTSVVFRPIEVVADSSIHLTFDLAGHVKRFVELDSRLHGMGHRSTDAVPPCGLSPQEGAGVAVVGNMVSVETDLSVPELLSEGQAQIVGTTLITDGLGLVRGRGN
jgi:hypothetical protein